MKKPLQANCSAVVNCVSAINYFFKLKLASLKIAAFLFIFCLSTIISASAQTSSTANYTTTSSATASMQSMANSIPIIDKNQDDVASVVIKIGFDFWFMGKRYDQLSANSNGAIRLGSKPISNTEYIGAGSTTPFPQEDRAIIAPFLANLATSTTTGQVHYTLTGTAPSRKFTIEFKDMKIKHTSASPSGTFQVSINETSGIINFDYATSFMVGSQPVFDVVVGFNSSNVLNTVKTINQVTPFTESNLSSPTIVNYATAGAVIGLQNKRITFTPAAAPTVTGGINETSITATGMNLGWTDIAGEKAYAIYGSTDNINFNFYAQTAADITSVSIVSLVPNKRHYWRLYACSEGQVASSFIIGNDSTVSAGAIITNTATITSEGTETFPKPFTYNWSSLGWTNGIPNATQNVEIILDIPVSTKHELIEIFFDIPNIAVNNLTIRNINSSAVYQKIINTQGLTNITILGDLIIKAPGGNKYNRALLGNLGVTTVFGKTYLGSITPTATEGHGTVGSASLSSFNQRVNLYDDLYVYPRGYTTEEWTIFSFLKPLTTSRQYLYNETLITDTVQPVMFQNLYVGNGIVATYLAFSGAAKDAYIRNVSSAGFSIFDRSTLDLPKTYSLTKLTGGGAATFTMGASAKIRLGGFSSISRTGVDIGVPGSNFPSGFTLVNANFNNSSTFEYSGDNSDTQIIYSPGGFNYKYLTFSNNSGITPAVGRAQKITNTIVRCDQYMFIYGNTDLTIGDILRVNTGELQVVTNGGLYCGTHLVQGSGTFRNLTNSILGLAHPGGITTAGTADGNIQMTNRAYSATANYTYYGTTAQVTGSGLPSTSILNFTVNNPTILTNSQNLQVSGTADFQQGIFDIGTTKLTSSARGTITSSGGKIKANLGIVELKGTNPGIAQYLSGSWFIGRNISTLINANRTGFNNSATPGDSLLISSALLFGAGITNSQILTRDNITLLSRDTGTANFGEIVDGSGNSIVGRVNIERYLFGKKAWRFLAAPVEMQATDASTPSIADAWREGNSSHATTGYGVQMTGPSGPSIAAAGGELDLYTVRGSLKYYNDVANTWTEIANTTTTPLANERGYMVFVRGDRGAVNTIAGAGTPTILRIKGNIRTGDQVFSVLPNKFQSFGNPYPARIDMRTVIKDNISTSFIVWNPTIPGLYNVGGYETYILTAGNYTKVGDPATIRNFIESGEAVFVQSNIGTAGSVTVKEADKRLSSSLQSRVGVQEPTLEINLYTKDANNNNNLEDAIVVNFGNNYSAGVDNDDVRKISNAFNNLSIKKAAENLIVEKRPAINADDTIHLNLYNTRVAAYSFTIDPSVMNTSGNLKAFMIDRFLNTSTAISLVEVTNLSFNITSNTASSAANRFIVVFKQEAKASFTTIAAKRNADNTIAVNWGIAYEKNVNNYEMQHSLDGVNFEVCALHIATANDGTNKAFSKIDAAASKSNNWYRIKIIHTDGSVTYSSVAMVAAIKEDEINNSNISIEPNIIVDNKINLRLQNKVNGAYAVKIYNGLGQLIKTTNVQVQSTNHLQIILLNGLAKGKYYILIEDEVGNKSTIDFTVN